MTATGTEEQAKTTPPRAGRFSGYRTNGRNVTLFARLETGEEVVMSLSRAAVLDMLEDLNA